VEDVMAKKLSLKPVEAELKSIREKLVAESKTASKARKKVLQGEIEKINNIIAAVPPACRRYSVG
jgi:hypothetical protein